MKGQISFRPSLVEQLESRFLLSSYWVLASAPNGGNGQQATPFNKIQSALNTAVAGDTIIVGNGTYRENLLVQAGHFGSAGNLLTIKADTGATPVVSGSDAVTGWTLDSGNIWKKTGWTTDSQQVFDDSSPLRQVKRPDGTLFDANGTDPDRLPDVDEGTTKANMTAGSFFYDATGTTLYVWLADGSNPNNSAMEASVRRRTFFADPTRGYIKIDGLTFEHSNAAAVTEQDALVTMGNNSIFQNSTARWGDLAGLSMGDTSSVQVINSQFLNNGQLGITGPGTDNYLIQGNTLTGNNYRNFWQDWHAGGIKITSGAYGTIDDNGVGSNNGTGIWFDFANSGNATTVRNNYIHDNAPMEGAVFVEASKNVTLYNNVLVNNNRRGVYVSGSDVTKVYNNTIVSQQGIAAIDVIARNGVNSTNTTIRNNIISGGTSTYDLRISGGTGNTSNYNDIYRSAGAIFNNGSNQTFTQWKALGFDVNSTTSNPTFATFTGDSYTLSSISPGKDTGTTLTEFTTDYAGTARPQGTAYDMGAYEYFTTLGTGLTGYWHLDENTGTTTADASGTGNTGTLVNGVAWVSPGKAGTANLSFDGVDDKVNVADNASLDFSSAMSVGGWFNHATSGGSGTVGVQKLQAYRLTAQEANAASSHWQFFFTDSVGVTHQVTTTSTYTNGSWHYVMGTFNGTQLQIYVDGVAAATAVNFTGSIANSAQAFQLGQRDSTAFYKGQMDEVRLYNRALSASEVADLYSSGGTVMLKTGGSKAKSSSQPVFSDRTIGQSDTTKKRKLIESL